MIDAATGFDAAFYLRMNPDVAAAGLDPLAHYRSNGFREGRDPSPLFDVPFYLAMNPDVAAAGIDPLQHYMENGFREGRNPSPLFDAVFYLATNPDVAAAGLNPLLHYVFYGFREGRSPNPLFSAGFYLRTNPDVAAAGFDAFDHYVRFGRFENRDPHPLFDSDFYLADNLDVAAAGLDPLSHFLRSGQAEGRNPNALFDSRFYLATNPDVAAAGFAAFDHFSRFGGREGRDPHPDFDSSFYLAANPDVAAAGVNPLLHFLGGGREEGRIPKLGVGTPFNNVLASDGQPRTLRGEGGDDILITGPAVNTLIGGAGADEFRYAPDPGQAEGVDGGVDVIADFNLLEGDRLRIAEYLGFAGHRPGDPIDGVHLALRAEGADTVVALRASAAGTFRDALRLTGVTLSYADIEYFGLVTTARDDAFRMVDSPFGFNGSINTTRDFALTPDGQFLLWSDQQNLDRRSLDLDANTGTFSNSGSTTTPTTYDVFLRNLNNISDATDQAARQIRVSENALQDVIRTFGSNSNATRFDADGAGISDDGRYAIFASDGPVVRAFASDAQRVYIRDVRVPDGVPVLVSRDTANAEIGVVARPVISGDGMHVAFTATPPQGDTGFGSDVLVRSWTTGRTAVASVVDVPGDAKNGLAGGGAVGMPVISGNGRFVAFTTTAPLTADDADTEADVYLRDMALGRTTLLSGGAAPGASSRPSMSRDGSVIAFQSDAALDPDDFNRKTDIYLLRLADGTPTQRFRFSETVDGFEAEGGTGLASAEDYGNSFDPVVSPDGSAVAFTTTALDLTPYDPVFYQFISRNGLGNNIDSLFERLIARDANTGAYLAPIQRNFVSQRTDPETAQYALSADGRTVAYQVLGPQATGSGQRADFGDAPLVAPMVAMASVDIGGTTDDFAPAPFVESGGANAGEFAIRSFMDTPGDIDMVFVDRDSRLFDRDEVVISVEGAATGRGTVLDPILRIRDPSSGAVVLSNDDGGTGRNARLFLNQSQFDNFTDGGYFIEVAEVGGRTGSYRLSVAPSSPGDFRTTPALLSTFDQTFSDSLQFTDTEDWYQVEGVAGRGFSIRADAFTAALDDQLTVRLHDRTGAVIASASPDTALAFTPGADDVFYASIFADGSATGTYTLTYDVF